MIESIGLVIGSLLFMFAMLGDIKLNEWEEKRKMKKYYAELSCMNDKNMHDKGEE